MSSVASAYPLPDYGALRFLAAAREVVAYRVAMAIATLCFLAGWLPVNGGGILTVVLRTTLILKSWVHIGQGQDPCFLCLCTLTLFQGGRLIASCLGAEPQPIRGVVRLANFDPARDVQGLALLGVVLAAIGMYPRTRSMFRRIVAIGWPLSPDG